jgi:signal transduction histidine kinase
MKLKSLRIQLPLSYAGIALLTALALGAVLLFTLRQYYLHQERSYLEANAGAMGHAVAQMMESGLPVDILEAQIENLSFLTLARISVLDSSGALIVDTGVPAPIQIASLSGGGGRTEFFVSAAPFPGGDFIGPGVMFVSGNVIDGSGTVQFEKMIEPAKEGGFMVQQYAGPGDVIGFVAPLGQSLYGYDLSSPTMDIGRSQRAVIVPLINPEGRKLGILQLSDGPAYGREIVESVAQAWVAAGLLAVILAAGAGGLVSRRMAAPVLALTTVTERMAQGDLSARAAVSAPEELAALGHSFNEMAERIEEMVSTLRNFVSDAAHELHTPLTALRTDLELASESQQHSPALLERALTQADRLQALVNNLLNLSRIESQESPHTPVNLSILVREMGEVYASRAEQLELSFVLESPDSSATILGNEMQIRSAIGNLLENAIKFTTERGQIQLSLKEEAEGWEISVTDNGIGIPSEEVSHLFRRFHRARNVSEYPGNGLGLAIVKAIADAHKGRVAVESLTPGARFSIWLPS